MRPPKQETYDKAWQHLECFEEVFDFENFSAEVQSYFQKQNLSFEIILHERNSKYPIPKKAERDLIAEYNKYDLLLFQKWKTSSLKK